MTGNLTTVTGANGRFLIAMCRRFRSIVVSAAVTDASNSLSGSSAAVQPVRGGVTDVGTITLVAAAFETNLGTFISADDDTYFQRTLPFAFPFYGANQTVGYVGTNGYITFGSGDSTYTEDQPAFQTRARISGFFDDLYGRSSNHGLFINDTLPGRFIATWYQDPHFSAGGSNTIQIQLFQNGRIVIAYNGITSLTTGTIVGAQPRAVVQLAGCELPELHQLHGAAERGGV